MKLNEFECSKEQLEKHIGKYIGIFIEKVYMDITLDSFSIDGIRGHDYKRSYHHSIDGISGISFPSEKEQEYLKELYKSIDDWETK